MQQTLDPNQIVYWFTSEGATEHDAQSWINKKVKENWLDNKGQPIRNVEQSARAYARGIVKRKGGGGNTFQTQPQPQPMGGGGYMIQMGGAPAPNISIPQMTAPPQQPLVSLQQQIPQSTGEISLAEFCNIWGGYKMPANEATELYYRMSAYGWIDGNGKGSRIIDQFAFAHFSAIVGRKNEEKKEQSFNS